ncbi:MAG: phosphotransferase family protein [Candidatus Hodarchaeales archaeon]|jgi:aminoglycoside phosphotransferase (APT) family kinase protein
MTQASSVLISGLKVFFQKNHSDHQNVEILDFNQILGGMETLIYSFKCKYNKNGKKEEKKLILRMYATENGAEFAQSEFEVLRELESVNYPVPKVFFRETSSNFLGKPFIILEYIDGVLMGEEMENAIKNDDSMKIHGLVNHFTELYIQLHEINWQALVDNPQHYLNDPKQNLVEFLSWYEKKIQKFDLISLIPILEWIQMKISSIESVESDLSLTHGDFHPNNIILADDTAYVIDWHGIRIRDYRIDLGQTAILTEMYASKDLRENFISLYESKAGKIENFAFFEVLLCLVRFYEFFEATTVDQESMTEERVNMFKEQSDPIFRAYSLVVDRTGQKYPELETVMKKILY